MGAYLSAPVTDKESFEGSDGTITFGGSAMQGWRRTMEDAHIASLNLGEHDISLFGVFDGHGGSEVAKFCSKYMVSEILQLAEVKNGGDLGQALVKLFHRMDDMLRSEDHSHELAEFKGKRSDDEESDPEVEGGSGQGVSPTDAIDLLKKFIAMKRQGNGGDGNGAATGEEGEASVLDQAEFIIEDDMQEDTLPEHSIQAGCTAVVALLKARKHLYIANAGDSRAVLSRRGTAIALSEDHKPAQERERTRIVAAGGFLSEIGGVCRVNGNLNLSRAIGDLKYKQNDTLPAADQIITAEPDICHIELTDEDEFFVLACDGVWDVMENQEVCDFVRQRLQAGHGPKDVACELLDACLASNPRDAKGIGCDNMTAQIVLLRPVHMNSNEAGGVGA